MRRAGYRVQGTGYSSGIGASVAAPAGELCALAAWYLAVAAARALSWCAAAWSPLPSCSDCKRDTPLVRRWEEEGVGGGGRGRCGRDGAPARG